MNECAMRRLATVMRTASPADSQSICRLYAEAYRPPEGGDPRTCYPFPQFLDPDCVARLVTSEAIRWFVAEAAGRIIGTVGAVVNIGTAADRVAECFGLVVEQQFRFHSIGSELFSLLCRSLDQAGEGDFIMAEARTAHSGGWKVVRRAGFSPIGFEPFAHRTPQGAESMLLTGRILPGAVQRRGVLNMTSAGARRLSEPICDGLGAPCYRQPASSENPLADTGCRHVRDVTVDEVAEEVAVVPMEHRGDVIGLHRLEGEDRSGARYRQRYFVARCSGRPIACARTIWDAFDTRLRLLDLKASQPGGEGPLIRAIVAAVAAEQGQVPHSVAVDVRADAIALHQDLCDCGFFPTVYYPALFADGDGRSDAVQFTRLAGFDLETARRSAELSEWPQAEAIAARVGPSGMAGFA
jgi:hypothetical protein